MQCPKCQFENRGGAKFCGDCGHKFVITCPECGTSNHAGNKFCDECGHELTSTPTTASKNLSIDEKIAKIQKYLPQGLTEKILSQRDKIEGERKQVTVMFCDMEGFTSFSEKLGIEEAYSIMDQVYEILIHKVHDFEGTVNEMTGDGIMALFGAPIALEDAPQRAIHSAMAIHREMTIFSNKIKQENEGIPQIKMRIGIHTGPVVVGTLGNDLRVEFKAVGDTVILASRIESLAKPGTAYVTEKTFKLTEGLFRFEGLGKMQIKGKKGAVKVYRVIGASTKKTRFDVSAERGLTPLIGRERELELLFDGFERAKEGKGQAFSIMAGAGVGKSRVLYEFRKAVIIEDLTLFEGKCFSYSSGIAYHPVIDMLKSNFAILDSDVELDIREKAKKGIKKLRANEAFTLPYILELLSIKDDVIETIPISPETRRNRIIEAVKRIALSSSETRPLIMVFEDLHWIDNSSEEVLKYLLDSISGARILLIFTYRPEYVHAWGGKSFHNQVNLNRLSNRESLSMVYHLLNTDKIDRKLEELILETTEGVPFFVEEFTTSLKDLGIIEIKNNKYYLSKDIQDVTIPSTIQDVIMAKVDSLPEEAKELVQIGSAIEREFTYELIKQVIEHTEQELLPIISVLKDSELLYEKGIYPQSIYVFRHALTQQVVYNSILAGKKKELHEKIGSAIEQIYPERLEEFCEVLAYHYSKSENIKKGYHFQKLSGVKAIRNYSNWDASRFCKEALNLINQLPETHENKIEKLEILCMMTIPLRLLAYPEDSLQIFEMGEKLSKELDDEKSLSIFHGRMGHYHSIKRGNPLLGIKFIEQSFQAAEKMQDIELMARTALDLSGSCMVAGQFSKIVDFAPGVIVLLEESKKEHESFGTGINVYSDVHSYYGYGLGMTGKFEEGIALIEKGLRFAAKINDKNSLGHIEALYGYLFFIYKRDGKNTIYHFENAIRYQEENKQLFFLGTSWMGLGGGYYLIGKLETAQKYIEKGFKIQKKAGLSLDLSIYFWLLSMVKFELGEYKNAQDYAEETLRLSREMNEKHREGQSNIWLGRIIGKKDTSKGDVAEEHILQGIKIFDELKMKPCSAEGHFFLGELYRDTDQKEKSVINLKKAAETFQEMGMDYWLAKTQEVLD